MLPDLPPLELGLLGALDGAGDGAGDVPSNAGEGGVVPLSDATTAGRDTPRDARHATNSWTDEGVLRDGGMRFATGARTPTIRNGVRNTGRTPRGGVPRPGESGPEHLLARDAETLHLIVRLRLASMQQVAALAFAGRSLTVARRRLRSLKKRGWITFWDRPSVAGAPIRYAVPTPYALAQALVTFKELAADVAFGPLLRRMLPSHARRLSEMEDGIVPSWLPHQDEINRLLVAIATAEGDRLVWYSSWDCPFPDRVNGLKAPQPDYVLVRTTSAGIAVTFGEHDRATEPLASWPEKIAAYAVALELAREWLGIEAFTVDVTVVDPSPRDPMVRLRELIELARVSGAASFMRFTLGGWLHAFPGEAVWFANGTVPANDSRGRRDHLDRLVA